MKWETKSENGFFRKNLLSKQKTEFGKVKICTEKLKHETILNEMEERKKRNPMV